jgi:hypothetical protein
MRKHQSADSAADDQYVGFRVMIIIHICRSFCFCIIAWNRLPRPYIMTDGSRVSNNCIAHLRVFGILEFGTEGFGDL